MFGNSVVCLVWYVWHGVVCLGCGVMCCVYMQLGAEGKGRRLEEWVGWGGGGNDKTDGPLGGGHSGHPQQ